MGQLLWIQRGASFHFSRLCWLKSWDWNVIQKNMEIWTSIFPSQLVKTLQRKIMWYNQKLRNRYWIMCFYIILQSWFLVFTQVARVWEGLYVAGPYFSHNQNIWVRFPVKALTSNCSWWPGAAQWLPTLHELYSENEFHYTLYCDIKLMI